MRDVYTLEAGFQEVKQMRTTVAEDLRSFPEHLDRLSSVNSPADDPRLTLAAVVPNGIYDPSGSWQPDYIY